MSANETYEAVIQEQEQKLTKKDLRGVYNTWYFSTELSNSYERLQALAFCNAISKPLRKLYKDDDKYEEALKRHLQFYNSEGTFGSMIHGITLSMEEQKSNGADIPAEVITGIKTGLMGPVAGIGDTIIWGTLKPIILALVVHLLCKDRLRCIYSVLIPAIWLSDRLVLPDIWLQSRKRFYHEDYAVWSGK